VHASGSVTELPARLAAKSTVPVAMGLMVAVIVTSEPTVGEAEKERVVWVASCSGETEPLPAEIA